jgi:prepilin-type processing-associated H-X9-DG protein
LKFTRKDLFVAFVCVVFLLATMGAIGSGGKRRAKEVICRANLKRWSVIWKSFTDDNGGYFTESFRWIDELKPYYIVDNLRLCPSATRTYREGGRPAFAAWEVLNDGTIAKGSYGLNQWVTQMFMDCQLYCYVCPYYYDEPPAYEGAPSTGNEDEMRRVCMNRHRGGINIVFLDFSVRKVGLKELWKLDWNRDWNPYEDPLPVWPEWMSNFKDPE